MTIRYGEGYVLESLDQFKRVLDVDWQEIAAAFPPNVQADLLDAENEIRADHGDDPVADVADVHTDTISEFAAERGTNSVIIDVLNARDREYVHLYDGGTHRIVELHPPVDEVTGGDA